SLSRRWPESSTSGSAAHESWAEDDVVVRSLRRIAARVRACLVVVGVAVGIGAAHFEEIGQRSGRARLRRVVGARAAILRVARCGAAALAKADLSRRIVDPKLSGTARENVLAGADGCPASVFAVARCERAGNGANRHRHVVAVDQTEIVIVDVRARARGSE